MGRAEDKRQAARDAVAQHGVRAGVPYYLEAAQAFIDGRHPEEAVDLLGELLVAQEKKRGLFGRVEKNPLGQSRAQVAVKFAEYARLSAPSEDVLQLLSELSLEFPDDSGIRRANADALYNAGYIADATEEYRYCLRLNPDDGQILSRLTDAYADMGRNDHAIEYLRRGMRVHAEGNDFGQAMHLAIRWLTMTPGAAEDVLLLLKDWPIDAVRRQLGGLNQLAMLAKRDDTRDAAWHKLVAAEFAAFGASGRPDAPQAPAEQPRPAPPQRPAPTPAPTSASPPPAAPAAAKPAAPTRPFQGITPAVQPQKPAASAPTPPAPVRPTQPHAPAAAQAPAPPAQQRPTPGASSSGSLPTIDKLLEEADRRAPAATPPAARPAPPPAARPPSSPAAQTPPSRAPQPTPPSPPPAAQARPPQPPAPAAPVVPPPVESKPEPVEAAAPAQTPEQPARPTAGGMAAGIKNFARRKAKELFDAGDYAEAAQSLERVARFGADSETLQMLLRCYTELNQPENAKRVGMQLADVEVEAGRVEAAVAALTTLAKTVPDPDVLKRRSELISAKK